MQSALPRELRSWGDEIGLLFRRWLWIAGLVLILSWLPPVPVVQVAFTVGCLAAVAFLGVWVAITARRMPRRPDEKWKRDVSRNVLAGWAAVATSRSGRSGFRDERRGCPRDQHSRMGWLDMHRARLSSAGPRSRAPSGSG